MKVNKPSANKSTVYNLCDGMVFQYQGEYYIKTDEHNWTLRECTCVHLIDGRLTHIYDSTVVEYYDAEVTIK